MENEIEQLKKSQLELLLEMLDEPTEMEEDERSFPSEEEYNLEKKALSKVELRQSITSTVGDIPSLLGTVADASQIQTIMLAIDMEALEIATSFADYKKNKIKRIEEISKSEDSFKKYSEESTKLIDNISNGTIIMPYMIKEGGLLGVISDVSTRATGVAKLIMSKFKGA
jgi:antirestriction protein